MRMNGMTLAMFLAALSLGSAGCGDNEPGSLAQANPKDTALMLCDRLVSFDEEGSLALLTGPNAEIRAARALLGYMAAVHRFQIEFTGEYGEDAWDELAGDLGGYLAVEVTDNRDKIDAVKFTVDGDTATGSVEGVERDIQLQRIDGKWYVRAELVTGGATPDENLIRDWNMVKSILDEHRNRIGKPDTNREQLSRQLNDSFALNLGN